MPSPTILHITADFPDPLSPNKTAAIAKLIEVTPSFRHVVYSLNRVSAWRGVQSLQFADDRIAVAYGAPRWGFLLAARLSEVTQWLLADLSARRWAPDAVQAHKLTIEGLVAEPIARHFGIPLLCSIQAKTDVKILRARPDLRQRYGRIWHQAQHVFPFSPRARETATACLGARRGPTTLLPCISNAENMRRAPIARGPRVVSIFCLDDHRRKNATTLIRAVAAARREIPDLTLDIYGRAQAKSLFELSRIIERFSATRFVRLKGPLSRECVQDTMGCYCAFVMPTLEESYGMVFAEALLAGVPILQTKRWGLHGLFRDSDIGYACTDPRSYDEVAQGIVTILANEAFLKSRIAELQCTGAFDILRRDHIAEAYRAAIEGAVGPAVGVRTTSLSRPCIPSTSDRGQAASRDANVETKAMQQRECG